MRRYRLWPLAGIVCCAALGSGCGHSEQAPLSADDKQKITETSRQAEINVRSYQINHSNLPPEQKQRLLEQVRSGATK